MRADQSGFTLTEILIASAIFMAASIPFFYLAAGAQRLARSQSEAVDLHQRARVAADKLRQDLTMAGAGPPQGRSMEALVSYLAPIVPLRSGIRSPDAELTAFGDRFSIIYVPGDGWQALLQTDMPSPSAGLVLQPLPGCPSVGLCGFTEGLHAMLLDTSGRGQGYEVFTVTGTAGELLHDSPNGPFSRAYGAADAAVVPVVQRVYYFDRSSRRLMLYDGFQSDVPLVDNVVELRISYFGDAIPGPGLEQLALSAFTDGPFLGVSPHRFDADLLRIRVVRVTVRLQAAADDVRGRGSLFARPGRSNSGYSYVPDFEVTFDVAPRNLRGPLPES
jgi:type II secretory pathway pseudopilin PulG